MDYQIIGLKRMIKRIEKLLLILVLKNEPQINADERRFNESVSMEKDCMGMSTYREAIRVVWESRTVRFRHDERRFNERD